MPQKGLFVPPGGFSGFAQQTVAVQALVAPKAPRKRRKVSTKKAATRKKAPVRRSRAATARKKTGKRLVKGSPAAKRRMAQLRKMRKR